MNENQTTWESREQQISFAKGIASLLQKIFGSILSASYQGAGEVADLLITGRGISATKMEEVRNLLTKSYKLDLHKIKNHGHVRGTILIHISEVSEASRKIVEEEILNKIILPERLKKQKENRQNISTSDVSGSKPKIKKEDLLVITEEIVENQNSRKMENFSIIKKGRYVLSVFLTAMFRFEGIILSDKKDKIFSFDEKRTDDCQTISFRNEAEAEMGHKALTWYYGESKDLPILEKVDVMVNFFSLSLERNVPKNISFCFPPVQGDSVEMIKKRAIHVFSGYHATTVYIIDENSFSIGYPRLVTTQKFFELVKEMGWEPTWEDDLIICKFRPKPEVAIDDTNAAGVTSETEEIYPATESTPEVEEVTPVPEPEKKVLGLGSSFVSPRSVSEAAKESEISKTEKITAKNLFTPAEAIEQFKKMFNDQNIWSKISHERKVKIFDILKEDTKNNLSIEDFVNHLLSSRNQFFTKVEVVSELQAIFKNPNFLNLPESVAEQVRLKLREELINLDPDDLAGDLLDLF